MSQPDEIIFHFRWDDWWDMFDRRGLFQGQALAEAWNTMVLHGEIKVAPLTQNLSKKHHPSSKCNTLDLLDHHPGSSNVNTLKGGLQPPTISAKKLIESWTWGDSPGNFIIKFFELFHLTNFLCSQMKMIFENA